MPTSTLKKRGDIMKKKKLFSVVAAVLAVFYGICTYLVFSGVRTNMITEFRNSSENLQMLNFSRLSDDSGIAYAAHTITSIATYSSFPTAAVLYDEDGNVIAKSGNYIMFYEPGAGEDKYCYLDDYLTSDTMKQISDFYKKYQSVRTYRIDYCIENGEIVPVRIFIKGFKKGVEKTEEVVFSDKKSEFTFNGENRGSIYDSFMTRDWMVDESHYNHKFYKSLREETFGSKITLEIGGSSSDGGGGAMGSDYFEWDEVFELDGKIYKAHIRSGFRPIAGVVFSPSFKGMQISFTIVFLLISAVIFYAANKIYNKNKQLEQSRIAFTSAAAHELKTPIAIIANQCECILENVAPEKNGEYVHSVYSEALRMNKLVATLLQYNKLISTESIKRERADISALVLDELKKYEPLMSEKCIDISLDLQNGAYLNCNKELVALAVDNFLSNAVKHTPENGEVRLSASAVQNQVRVAVYNSGSQINGEDAPHIWEEFYKNDKARVNDGSTGMGLAISRCIFDLHGFKYGFGNLSRGVEFWFEAKN